MTLRSHILPPLALLLGTLLLTGCSVTSHPVTASTLGKPSRTADLLKQLGTAGPISVQKILAARWSVDRAGLVNLDHPLARRAGLEPGDEPIEIYFYRVTHPQFGTFLIDSGVAAAFAEPLGSGDVSWIVRSAMNLPALRVLTSTQSWLAANRVAPAGVFLTHLHLDHIMGLADLPPGTPVYVGPGEAGARSFQNAFTRGTTGNLLRQASALREWQFAPDEDGGFAGVIDVFGDGSMWALHVPGHTPGSTAFAIRSTDGPLLITGDASHTAWGWEQGVEPGTFSTDQRQSAVSLASLKQLEVALGSSLRVHPGHQSLPARVASARR